MQESCFPAFASSVVFADGSYLSQSISDTNYLPVACPDQEIDAALDYFVPTFCEAQGELSRPPFTFCDLIAQALYYSPAQKATVDQICLFVQTQYPFYAQDTSLWQLGIRQVLDLASCFVSDQPQAEQGSQSYFISQNVTFDGVRIKLSGSANRRQPTPALSWSGSRSPSEASEVPCTPATSLLPLLDADSAVCHKKTRAKHAPHTPLAIKDLNAELSEAHQASTASPEAVELVKSPRARFNFTPSKSALAQIEAWKQSTIRPGFTFSALIMQAIVVHPDKAPTLPQIYNYIVNTYPYYRNMTDPKGWQNSVRHNLSLKSYFIRSAKSKTSVFAGKGAAWTATKEAAKQFDGAAFKKDGEIQAFKTGAPSKKRAAKAPHGKAHERAPSGLDFLLMAAAKPESA